MSSLYADMRVLLEFHVGASFVANTIYGTMKIARLYTHKYENVSILVIHSHRDE